METMFTEPDTQKSPVKLTILKLPLANNKFIMPLCNIKAGI